MVKEFDDAVFALAPYEATVVETVFGVHLVQRTR
jgi:parvulin-like peptidyl-prolyl isomerase